MVSSSAWLAVTAPGLWWLLPFGVLTWQPHLLGRSYIALTTGALVASTGSPVFWLLPAVVGQLTIAVAERRLHTARPMGLPA